MTKTGPHAKGNKKTTASTIDMQQVLKMNIYSPSIVRDKVQMSGMKYREWVRCRICRVRGMTE